MGDLLAPDLGLTVWTVVTFLILVGILKAFAWGPLLKAVDEREARLKADREGAEKARAEAERIQKELESQLAGVQAKTKDLLAAAMRDGRVIRVDNQIELVKRASGTKDLATEPALLSALSARETGAATLSAADAVASQIVELTAALDRSATATDASTSRTDWRM